MKEAFAKFWNNVKSSKKWNIIKKIIKYYLITRFFLVIMIIIFSKYLPNSLSEYYEVFSLFDNEHYLAIAQNGYTYNYQFAFFPLTALLIRYLGEWGFLILNQVFALISGHLLYIINEKIFKSEDDDAPLFFWFISPISIFTCMFYSEGTFLFLTITAFYLYKTKKNYLWLGLVLGFAVLTRSLGSMLFFTIFIFMMIEVINKKEKFKNVLITYVPATILSCLYPIYLYFKTGDFLYFVNVEFLYWYRTRTNIFRIFYDALKYVNFNNHFIFIFNFIFTLFLFIYILVVIFKNRKEKKYCEIYLYMIMTLISISSTIKMCDDPLASFYRYIFGCFPIYFMLKKKYLSIMFWLGLTIFITFWFLSGIYFY